MKKMKLSLKHLEVNSFEVSGKPTSLGTVKGNLTATESIRCLSELGCNTDEKTCGLTCINTCANSCQGTCEFTCPDTCNNNTCLQSCEICTPPTSQDTCDVFNCKDTRIIVCH